MNKLHFSTMFCGVTFGLLASLSTVQATEVDDGRFNRALATVFRLKLVTTMIGGRQKDHKDHKVLSARI